MKRRTRINYTPEQKVIIWDRYKQGDSLHDIPQNVRQISLYYHAYNPLGRWLPSSRAKAAPVSVFA